MVTMTIHINPGSEPVPNTTPALATANIGAFVADLRAAGIDVTSFTPVPALDYGDGRYAYMITTADHRAIEVQMPGLPLAQVRFMDERDQNVWDFPRLYVNDSSWLWMFALKACQPDF